MNLLGNQGRHGEFEPGKAQYFTLNVFDRLFLIRAYCNPKFRQGPGLRGLTSRPALTVAINELLCMKNAGAQTAMYFS